MSLNLTLKTNSKDERVQSYQKKKKKDERVQTLNVRLQTNYKQLQ